MSLVTSGWFRKPISKRVSIRRSTIILVVGFVALLALYLSVRPKTVDDEQPSPVPVVTTVPAADVPATDTPATEVPATVGS